MLTNIRFTMMDTRGGLELVVLYMTGMCFLASYLPQIFRSFFAASMVALSNVLFRGGIRIFLFDPVRQPSPEELGQPDNFNSASFDMQKDFQIPCHP